MILITTKKGSVRKGIGVEINSNFVAESPLLLYENFQYEYGSGSQGLAATTKDEAISFSRFSWGPKIAGQNVIQFDGSTAPYVAHKNNLKDFYEVGTTFTNTLALSGGSEKATFRFSASDLNHSGYVPNSSLRRNTFNLRGTANLSKRLSADIKANFIKETTKNRPGLSDSPENPGLTISELATTVDQALLKNYKDDNGNQIRWGSSSFRVNPYFAINESPYTDSKDRLIGLASLKYQFADWLSLMVRGGIDRYTLRNQDVVGFGTPYKVLGGINENNWTVQEINADFLFLFNKQISENFAVNATLGGNHRMQSNNRISASGDNFAIPGFNHLSNAGIRNNSQDLSKKEVNSFYGSAQVAYKNYLFVDVSGRNDWSSSLTGPLADNSFFYPAASLAFAFTDAFDIAPNILSFGKARVSWAKVGNDTDPYQLNLTYSITQPHLGNNTAQIGTDRIPLANLQPEDNTALELGLDLRFFKNRFGIDLTWYKQNSSNFIVPVSISMSSGYRSAVVNAGEIQNKGVELLLTGNPVKTAGGFSWDISFNFARNRNEVLSLKDPVEVLTLGQARDFTSVVARVGKPYGTIEGTPYRRTFDGQIIYRADGRPETGLILYNPDGTPKLDGAGNVMTQAVGVLGNANPDWTGGLTNTFTFKGIIFSSIIDIRQGGNIHSMTNLAAYARGNDKATLEGREAYYAGTGGVIGKGVVNVGTPQNPEYQPNTNAINPQIYFGSLPAEQFVYDASFIKMRQMSLGYSLPSGLLGKTPFQAITLSIVGRNLFFIQKKVPNIDPESVYSSQNGSQGLEYGTLPTTRSWGFNLNIKL